MNLFLGNKRLSVPENWQPTLEVFTNTLIKHKIYVDPTKEYEKLYGRANKKAGITKKKTTGLRKKPKSKSRTNSKS